MTTYVTKIEMSSFRKAQIPAFSIKQSILRPKMLRLRFIFLWEILPVHPRRIAYNNVCFSLIESKNSVQKYISDYFLIGRIIVCNALA